MKKINFTDEHRQEMVALATEFLFQGTTFKGALSTPVTVYDLIHNTTINSLNGMNNSLKNLIKQKEDLDEWSLDEPTQRHIESLKEKQQFIHLLIGYKRYLTQQENIAAQRARLQEELAEMKESTKTPEERIKEMEAALAALG